MILKIIIAIIIKPRNRQNNIVQLEFTHPNIEFATNCSGPKRQEYFSKIEGSCISEYPIMNIAIIYQYCSYLYMQNQSQLAVLGQPPKKVLYAPQKCLCEYETEISAYRCSFQIQNISIHPIYLSITSTFLHFLQLDMAATQVSAGEIKKIVAKIRPPNQIYPQEFIAISYSFNKHAEFLAVFDPDCIKSIIKIVLNAPKNQDPQIDSMLQEFSTNQQLQAAGLFNLGEYKSALQKSEEAFTIYRKNLACLITMSQSELKYGNLAKATNKIQLLLYYPEHPDYFKATLIKVETMLLLLTTIDLPHKLAFVKSVMAILKDGFESKIVDETSQQRFKKVMGQLQTIKHELISKSPHGLLEDFLERAISDFNKNEVVKKNFKDQTQFREFLTSMVNKSNKTNHQTPEYALDPINYEIFRDPVITPTGLSYERQFIVNFFKKNGPKDPFTRDYCDQNLVFPNITLKILVRNNPLLPKWIKYEEEATKM